MEAGQPIVLCGASTRAAAFSALRAGFRPWCVDLFADRDLQACCPVTCVTGKYPESLIDAVSALEPGPWMYTGGLENHPTLVRRMSGQRELWGNNADVLRLARDPIYVTNAVRLAGLPAPRIATSATASPDRKLRWLVKPLRGAGGRDITLLPAGQLQDPGPRFYLQEYIEGEPAAAVFVGDSQSASLLGFTQQLVGEAFCNATAFHYCGSIGPTPLGDKLRIALERLGSAVTLACHLRGLFGIDGILRDGEFWPVEINPRYTASIEVLEYATGFRSLSLHRDIFVSRASGVQPMTGSPLPFGGEGLGVRGLDSPPVSSPPHLASRERKRPEGVTIPPGAHAPGSPQTAAAFIGKAIIMAGRDLVFPTAGPWDDVINSPGPITQMPLFADIPKPGERIKAGRPVLTLLACSSTLSACRQELRERALDLDRYLVGP